jgi:hypothetical protein
MESEKEEISVLGDLSGYHVKLTRIFKNIILSMYKPEPATFRTLGYLLSGAVTSRGQSGGRL